MRSMLNLLTQCEKLDFEVESIKHADQLATEEKLALQTLINKYRNCFATQMSELSKVKSTECDIITVPKNQLLSVLVC